MGVLLQLSRSSRVSSDGRMHVWRTSRQTARHQLSLPIILESIRNNPIWDMASQWYVRFSPDLTSHLRTNKILFLKLRFVFLRSLLSRTDYLPDHTQESHSREMTICFLTRRIYQSGPLFPALHTITCSTINFHCNFTSLFLKIYL